MGACGPILLAALSVLAAGSVLGAEPPPRQVAREALGRFADTVVEARAETWTAGSQVHMATRPAPMALGGLCRVNQVIETFMPGQPVQLDAFFRFRLLVRPDWTGAPAFADGLQDGPDAATVAGCKALTSSAGFFRATYDIDAWQGSRLFAQAMVAVNAGPPWTLEVLCPGGAPCGIAAPFGAPRPEFIYAVAKARCPPDASPRDGCYRIDLAAGSQGETWAFVVQGYEKPSRLRLLEHGFTIE